MGTETLRQELVEFSNVIDGRGAEELPGVENDLESAPDEG
jgi:hypothetical protein